MAKTQRNKDGLPTIGELVDSTIKDLLKGPMKLRKIQPIEMTMEELRAWERDTWSEEIFQDKTLEMAIGFGWEAVHFEKGYTGLVRNGKPMVRTPYKGKGKGWPDTVGIHERLGLGIAWELKSKRGKPEPEQLRWLNLFGLMGFDIRVCYPKDWDSMMLYLEKGKR